MNRIRGFLAASLGVLTIAGGGSAEAYSVNMMTVQPENNIVIQGYVLPEEETVSGNRYFSYSTNRMILKRISEDNRVEGTDEPITEESFYEMLYGSGNGVTNYISRERAAVLLYDYLLDNGVEEEANGNLSMFRDGLFTTADAVRAVSVLVQLTIMRGNGDGTLRPRSFLTEREAILLIERTCDYITVQEDSDDRISSVLGSEFSADRLVTDMLSCVISAMLADKVYELEEPDLRLVSESMYNAISYGIVPDEICEYKQEGIVILTQEGMVALYNGMFNKGFFKAFDPVAGSGRVEILGEYLVFMPVERPKPELRITTAATEANGGISIYCTVYEAAEYRCTAKVNLVEADSWASGVRINSIKLTLG